MDNATMRVELERIKFAVGRHFPYEEKVDICVEFDYQFQEIAVMVRCVVWAEDQAVQRVDFSWPQDWWQHFKQRWFPKWATKKWPVKMEERSFDVKCIYPTFKPALKKHDFRLMLQEREKDAR